MGQRIHISNVRLLAIKGVVSFYNKHELDVHRNNAVKVAL